MREKSTQSQSQLHVDSAVRQEEKAPERRSSSERFADALGGFTGSLLFFVLPRVLVVSGRQAHPPPRAFRVSGAVLSKLEC